MKTNYRVVSDANGGDAVLTGKVLKMEVVLLLFQTTSTATTSTAQRDGDACDHDVRSDVDGPGDGESAVSQRKSFVFRNEYQLSTDVRNFFQEGDPALDRMAQDFAARL